MAVAARQVVDDHVEHQGRAARLGHRLVEVPFQAVLPLDPADVEPLNRSGIPYVLVNRHFDHIPEATPANCVTADWVEGTRDAVRRLHRLGHRRMAALFPRSPSLTSTALDHERGWADGLAEFGLTTAEAPILHPVSYVGDEATGYELGRRLLTQGLPETGERPTAIVGYNDHFAHGVIRAARDLGIAIPGQLSVIGFDNSIGEYLYPKLCSYDPHLYAIGEQSALLLGSLLRGDHSPRPHRIMLPLDYICRETCAPAPRLDGDGS